jgi:hypothetical protein
MPRTFAPRAGIDTPASRLAVSVNAAVGTFHHRAACFTPACNHTTIRSNGCAATLRLAMGINISVRTFNHCATRFASASSRAIGSNYSATLIY